MRYVFISYRRSDSSDITGRIFDSLKTKFGEDALFKDVDDIPVGWDFRTVISEAVGQCRVLLVVIGDDWLEASDKAGHRRIDDPSDYVHIEIATALKRGIPVVPILVENALMPQIDDLPGPLKELSFRNGMPVRPDPDFHNDMNRLSQQLARYVETGRWKGIVRRPNLPFNKWVPLALVFAVFFLVGVTLWSRIKGPKTLRPVLHHQGQGDRPPVRYWIDDLPRVAGEDAAKLFTNALGSWEAAAGIPMRRADTRDEANVIARTQGGVGTVAEVGPPAQDGRVLVITFNPNGAWTPRSFEAASCRMIGHVLGLTYSDKPGQVMSPPFSGMSFENIPLVPQADDIERVRRIWHGAQPP